MKADTWSARDLEGTEQTLTEMDVAPWRARTDGNPASYRLQRLGLLVPQGTQLLGGRLGRADIEEVVGLLSFAAGSNGVPTHPGPDLPVQEHGFTATGFEQCREVSAVTEFPLR